MSSPPVPVTRYSDAASPLAMCRAFWVHRHLLIQITRRDIMSRYRGSVLGLVWSFITPLLMLAVYTFVFGVVFKARFGGEDGMQHDTADFAVTLFCGLMIHSLLAEVMGRAPSIILNHANYVKKVVFPLEILPVMVVGSALFNFLMAYLVLCAGLIWINGTLPLTALYMICVLLPYLLMLLGLSWVLAALGVYLRDVGHMTGLVSTLLLFLSPIFYPVTALPERFQPVMALNPLTPVIEQSRHVIIDGGVPDIGLLGIYTLGGLVALCFGFAWFQKTRKGFADIM